MRYFSWIILKIDLIFFHIHLKFTSKSFQIKANTYQMPGQSSISFRTIWIVNKVVMLCFLNLKTFFSSWSLSAYRILTSLQITLVISKGLETKSSNFHRLITNLIYFVFCFQKRIYNICDIATQSMGVVFFSKIVEQGRIHGRIRRVRFGRGSNAIRHGAGSYQISYSVLLKYFSSNLTKSIMSRGQICVSDH